LLAFIVLKFCFRQLLIFKTRKQMKSDFCFLLIDNSNFAFELCVIILIQYQ